VEEGEMQEIENVRDYTEKLRASLPDTIRILSMTGRMKAADKALVMDTFSAHEADILVSTTVIEVGINVPNATVILIENAERFGLAQLHQLRGRVGRGKWQSYCFLLVEGNSEVAVRRGEIMEKSTDGFYIAEEDLKLRGPGEIFGTRQHGLPDMRLADMARHMDVLNAARDEARRLLEEDPGLEKPQNQPLKRRVTRLFGSDLSLSL
jgi:ATP-dependent DNA helicase RecG